MTRGWRWWLAFFLLPDSHRLHWHQLAWRTVIWPPSAIDPQPGTRPPRGQPRRYCPLLDELAKPIWRREVNNK